MAIIIQENGRKGMIIPLLIGGAVLIVAALLAYYLFFSPAPIVDIIGSSGYQSTSVFSVATLDIDSVVNSQVWNAIQKESLVPPIVSEVISAKENPFQSFSPNRTNNTR
ncbi:MAG: hypothetical protein WC519_00015 [Parcubacteria group bacterium]